MKFHFITDLDADVVQRRNINQQNDENNNRNELDNEMANTQNVSI